MGGIYEIKVEFTQKLKAD